jgi:hypothetical protein
MGLGKITLVLVFFAVATYLYVEGLLVYVLGAFACIYILYVLLFKWPNTKEAGMSAKDIGEITDEDWDEWTSK